MKGEEEGKNTGRNRKGEKGRREERRGGEEREDKGRGGGKEWERDTESWL